MTKKSPIEKQNKLYILSGFFFIVAFIIGAFAGHAGTSIAFLPLGFVFITLGMVGKAK
jgi:hypothetical protein